MLFLNMVCLTVALACKMAAKGVTPIPPAIKTTCSHRTMSLEVGSS
jgi:hypothetical protein